MCRYESIYGCMNPNYDYWYNRDSPNTCTLTNQPCYMACKPKKEASQMKSESDGFLLAFEKRLNDLEMTVEQFTQKLEEGQLSGGRTTHDAMMAIMNKLIEELKKRGAE